jgi:hypothetical protein
VTDKRACLTPYLASLQQVSEKTREEIAKITIEFLQGYGVDPIEQTELNREMFLAALDGMADLVQYGELGPAAIGKIHRAREHCGIPIYCEDVK